jgi:hypothetical protein
MLLQVCAELLRHAVDGRADQYAWALVAWELYTGEPFARLGVDAAPSKAAESGMPAALLNALLRALSMDKRTRFPSMDAVIATIADDRSQARPGALVLSQRAKPRVPVLFALRRDLADARYVACVRRPSR